MPRFLHFLAIVATWQLLQTSTLYAAPTEQQALALKPVQAAVDYAIPTTAATAKCKIEAARNGGSGWIVRDENGQMLRRFLDTNRDKKLDQWSYFKSGIEVYRDIDANFNGKADQYRWLGLGGTRWGVDQDEDGKIDLWQMISPEEATSEVVAALQHNAPQRFRRLLLTPRELDSLGLGKGLKKDLAQRIDAAKSGIATLIKSQKMVDSNSKWLHFGATQPGIIPAGTDGSTKDLLAYDNATAIIGKGGENGQVSVGTLIRVGDAWRVVDLPKSNPSAGFFYASIERVPDEIDGANSGISEALQTLISELEKVDSELASSSNPDAIARLNQSRADVLQRIIKQASTPKDRDNWIRQLADSINAAVQSGDFPDGLKRLAALLDDLRGDKAVADVLPYVRFQYLTADYGQKLQKPNADFAKVQAQWLKDLEAFTKDYTNSESTPEAMLQLAMAHEFAGNDSSAGKWYGKIVSDFPNSRVGRKAAGAKWRLESVGKSISFAAPTLGGKQVDLSDYRGKVVLLHYWATWCEPCKDDLKMIKALQAKYGSQGFAPIGVNLDSDAQTARRFLATTPLAWPQAFEPGGLDSRLANDLGVMTLPTMLLIDKSGRVIRRNIHSAEVQAEVERLLE